MKGIKKLLTGILAATMIMGASVTAFADEPTTPAASITITPKDTQGGTVESITYTYYQIMKASLGEGTTASYYLDSEDTALVGLLEGTGAFKATLSADSSRYTIALTKENISGEDLCKLLNKKEIKDAAIKTDKFYYNKDTGKAESGALDPGYYLVESSLGSVVALRTLKNETIEEKNTYIVTDKTVAKTNYNIGEKVQYTATVYIPDTTEIGSDVILHDKMDSVLSFNNDVASTEEVSFSVEKDNPVDEDCTFEITIPVTKEMLNKTFTFTYSATLTKNAAGYNGFVNELFGENNNYKTKSVKPVVYTFSFDLLKQFEGADDKGYTADFEVRTAADKADTAIWFVKDGTKDYKKAETTNDQGASKTVTVTQGITSNFYGLAAGTYYLVETATNAEGYNILAKPVAVTITAGEKGAYTVKYSIDGENESEGVVTIVNTSGTILPSTGGIGTTIFYIIGGILIVAGVAYFILRRKSAAE